MSDAIITPFTDIIIDLTVRIGKLEHRLEAHVALDNRIDELRLAAYDAHLQAAHGTIKRRLAGLEEQDG